MRSKVCAAVVVRASLALSALLAGSHAAAAATTPIKVMTYNTHHGGTATSPATTQSQIDTIADENPDVVVLQEAYYTQLGTYVNGLNSRQNTTAWHGSYNRTCKSGTEPNCTSFSSESVMILTRLKTVAVTPRLIWAKDDYHVARATLRMAVELADGTQVNVFVAHLPALVAYASARVTWVNTFKTWAASFEGPKVVGGDFNERPTENAILSMTQLYSDAWAVGGSGTGYTHTKDGTTTLYRRIDYLFFDKASGLRQNSVRVVGDVHDSDHVAVVAAYEVPSMAPLAPQSPAVVETTLFSDGFSTFDASQWPTRVITGSQDSTIRFSVTGGRLRIGDLKEATGGAHYYGISTAGFNLATSGCASVQLAQSPSLSTTAYSMFAVVKDTNNLYRWYQSGDELVVEKKVAGVKTKLASLQYTPATHQFLRIRKAANAATGTQDVVFETAVDNGGVPGTFTERFRETWNAKVAATSLKVELKAGTSVPEFGAGSVYWDNARVATNCK
jgi:endonuclease/exonuclease/phosphatase family metal-dependent hydrolase